MEVEQINWNEIDLATLPLEDLTLLLLAVEERMNSGNGTKPQKQLLERQLALAHLIQHRLEEQPICDVNALMGYAQKLREKYGPEYSKTRQDLYAAKQLLAAIARMSRPYKDSSQEGK